MEDQLRAVIESGLPGWLYDASGLGQIIDDLNAARAVYERAQPRASAVFGKKAEDFWAIPKDRLVFIELEGPLGDTIRRVHLGAPPTSVSVTRSSWISLAPTASFGWARSPDSPTRSPCRRATRRAASAARSRWYDHAEHQPSAHPHQR